MEPDGLAGDVCRAGTQLRELCDPKMPGRKQVRRDIASKLEEGLELRARLRGRILPRPKALHDIAKRLRAPIRAEDSDVRNQAGLGTVEIETAERPPRRREV